LLLLERWPKVPDHARTQRVLRARNATTMGSTHAARAWWSRSSLRLCHVAALTYACRFARKKKPVETGSKVVDRLGTLLLLLFFTVAARHVLLAAVLLAFWHIAALVPGPALAALLTALAGGGRSVAVIAILFAPLIAPPCGVPVAAILIVPLLVAIAGALLALTSLLALVA
jgi:hypothetical protein